MGEHFQLVVRPRVSRQLLGLSAAYDHDPNGPARTRLAALLGALDAVKHGRERDFAGERLGYSPQHFDFRDCAEIKVPYVAEFGRSGKPLGPSHRLIYREFHPPAEGQAPVREVVCFEARANGKAFQVAGQELRRARGTQLATLRGLQNTTPALGPNKDPEMPADPPRLPLPPEVAAALRTSMPHQYPRRMAIAPSQPARFGVVSIGSMSPIDAIDRAH